MSAYYSASFDEFKNHTDSHVLGELFRNDGFATDVLQKNAWAYEISSLRQILCHSKYANNFRVILEYKIPRRGKRIDCVLLISDIVFVIEYKVGSSVFNYSDRYQVEDYALDLRDFHSGSFSKRIVPILVASEGAPGLQYARLPRIGEVGEVQNSSDSTLGLLIDSILAKVAIEVDENLVIWEHAPYHPTPTIIEAAQSLYAGQGVREITRSYASAAELHSTTKAIVDAVEESREIQQKRICFVTGVPGAGKTLVGLNIVHNRSEHEDAEHLGVFLSGNGPLVAVLKESLARDRSQSTNQKIGVARREVSTFIQGVHNFIDEYTEKPELAPPDRVVIFDEAQRAWDAERSWSKFKRKASEPEQLLEILDRHDGWAVFVALIGGGQEINSGEAGLPEWGRVLVEQFPHWRIDVSPLLLEGDVNAAIRPLFSQKPEHLNIFTSSLLHLDVTQRSYRAQQLNEFVEALLDNRPSEAKLILQNDLADFPLFLCRDIASARRWLKERTRGNRRSGLVASSGGRRLRAEGIDVQVEFDVAQWFLEPRNDVRSSYALEVPATEFQIQGLELDWIGLCWDLDLRRGGNNEWGFYRFAGNKWQVSRKVDRQRFQLNKYRVLLTRARQGMVIYIPKGDDEDHSRPRKKYDRIFEYLASCGIPQLGQ